MKRNLKLILTLILLFGFCHTAIAGQYIFTPNPADLDDLDHYYAYRWGMDVSNLPAADETIIGATLFFNNIRNYNDTDNDLYVSVLTNQQTTGVTDHRDNQASGNLFAAESQMLFQLTNIGSGGRDIAVTLTTDDYRADLLDLPEFATPPDGSGVLPSYNVNGNDTDYWTQYTVYNENGTGTDNSNNPADATLYDGVGDGGSITVHENALEKLAFYAQGNILGLGFDPDCHFYNSGVSLILWTKSTPDNNNQVPEPASMALFGVGLLFFASRLRKNRAA